MIEIMRWNEFQHYRKSEKRKYPPLWIKSYPKILENPLFVNMSPVAQLLLWKLWLLTSQAKCSGNLAMNIQEIAWRLRMDEGETYRAVMELKAVKNEDGQPQWIEWTETPIDHVLKQRLDHEGSGSRPSIDVSEDPPDEGEDEKIHFLQLEKSRNAEDTGENEVGLDLSHATYRENKKEDTRLDPPADGPTSIPVSHETDEVVEVVIWNWIEPYVPAWEKRFGVGSFTERMNGRMARAIGPIRQHYKQETIVAHWELYCETKEAEYATPENFASHFADFDPNGQQLSSVTPDIQ